MEIIFVVNAGNLLPYFTDITEITLFALCSRLLIFLQLPRQEQTFLKMAAFRDIFQKIRHF